MASQRSSLELGKSNTQVEHDEFTGPSHLESVSYGSTGLGGLRNSSYATGAALLASLGGFSMGYDMGVISLINVMDQFHERFPQVSTAWGKELMTAMLLLGAFVGCLFMPYTADKISRKWALTIAVVIFNIGAILQTAAVDYAMLVVGRFIGGIGVGTLAMGAPLYISEIAPPNIRGTLLVFESVCITSAVAVAYWITFGTRYIDGPGSFQLPFGLQMVSATLLGVGIHFFPYSPRWLALVDRNEECLQSLSKLRALPAHDERVQLEYQGIVAEVVFQRKLLEKTHPDARGLKLELLTWLDLFTKKNWRRTAVGCGVAFFQQFAGINAFIYYAPTLFKGLGQTEEMSIILAGVFDIAQFVAVVPCILLIDKIGRRPLAIYGAFGMAISYAVISVLSGLYSTEWLAHVAAGWGCVAMVFMFVVVYGATYSPLGWALPSEVFSNATRSKGVAISSCTIWLSDFVVSISVPSMFENITWRTYIFFTVMCFLAGIWAFLLVPETSGKTLPK